MNAALKRFLTIVLGSIGFACALGIGVDSITANVAVEYFSVHHPRIVPSENPWILALAWGVAASWWFGLIAGLIVAFINHRRAEPLAPRRILRWNLIACVTIWALMLAVVLGVYLAAGTIPIEKRPATFEHDRRLVAVAMGHQYEYLLGAIAGVTIAIMTWRAKARPGTPIPPLSTPAT
ncbi:MAG: hypothetical protein U0798_03470 [Gemmataceae bacterium]